MNTPKLPPLPERDPRKPAEQQGVFRKFDVRRTDGSSEPGGKHHGCEYFVLDVDHDQAARSALKAYADAVEATHPLLAANMRKRYALAAIEAQGVPDAMRTALQRIADRKSHDLQLAVGRGSNGVRDFYRQIAIDALASAPPAPQAAVVQQEPTSFLVRGKGSTHEWATAKSLDVLASPDEWEWVPQYTHPAQQAKPQPLSDEQRSAIVAKWKGGNWTAGDIIDAVEAAHGIKE